MSLRAQRGNLPARDAPGAPDLIKAPTHPDHAKLRVM
jgi:hypothetical protein